jgi:hypothetical protein
MAKHRVARASISLGSPPPHNRYLFLTIMTSVDAKLQTGKDKKAEADSHFKAGEVKEGVWRTPWQRCQADV